MAARYALVPAAAGWLLSLSVPVLLVLLAVRMVMTPLFLQIEYHRPGFPDDPFGFTRDDRLAYAPFALDYLIYRHDIRYLSDLRFPDGSPLFNARELRHMRDVQAVTDTAFLAAAAAGVLALGSMMVLVRSGNLLRLALKRGAFMTWGAIALVIVLAIVGWNTFFTGFHTLLFEDGTWYFLTSDTLIRLFPEQFWFDAALVVGGLAAAGAGVLWLVIGFISRS